MAGSYGNITRSGYLSNMSYCLVSFLKTIRFLYTVLCKYVVISLSDDFMLQRTEQKCDEKVDK